MGKNIRVQEMTLKHKTTSSIMLKNFLFALDKNKLPIKTKKKNEIML
jgi:hypothetical protein